MVTTRDERIPMTLDQVLLAINPQQGLNKNRIRNVAEAINEARRDGESDIEEIEEVVKMLIASSVHAEVNNIIGSFFVPSGRSRLGLRVRARNTMSHGRRPPARTS